MKKLTVWALMIGLLVTMSACDSTSSTEGKVTGTPVETVSQNESQTKVLWDDENVRVTFVEIYEVPELVGTCYLRLKVENKSDKTFTVYLKDSYVNDTAQMIGSGIPMELAPGKNSQTPFFFGYGNLGITSKDEIDKIEFKVFLMDEGSDIVVETEALVVEFNK